MADGFMGRYEEHMEGRNGADAISRTCLVVALVLIVLSFFVVGVGPFLYVLVLLLGIAAAVYAAFRMNSRNIRRRQAENEAFLSIFKRGSAPRDGRRGASGYENEYDREYGEDFEEGPADERPHEAPRRRVRRDSDSAYHESRQTAQGQPEPEPEPEPQAQPSMVTVSCESCGQRLNIPTGKGNIRVTCPRCSHQFTMMS